MAGELVAGEVRIGDVGNTCGWLYLRQAAHDAFSATVGTYDAYRIQVIFQITNVPFRFVLWI